MHKHKNSDHIGLFHYINIKGVPRKNPEHSARGFTFRYHSRYSANVRAWNLKWHICRFERIRFWVRPTSFPFLLWNRKPGSINANITYLIKDIIIWRRCYSVDNVMSKKSYDHTLHNILARRCNVITTTYCFYWIKIHLWRHPIVKSIHYFSGMDSY